jgi:outer membrane protein assembly factor BamD (BamD/ComL family)
MRAFLRFTLFILFLAVVVVPAFAFSDGLEALQKKKYDKAFTIFKEALDKNPDDVVASYGMSKLLSLPEYQLYNLEKAYVHIINAKGAFSFTDDKTKKKLLKAKIDEQAITDLQNQIDSMAYAEVVEKNTIEAAQEYLDVHKNSLYADKASQLKEDLAFAETLREDTDKAYQAFMEKYPRSKNKEQAKKKYDKLLYQKVTASKDYKAYKFFIENYPDSPYAEEAKQKYEVALFKHLTADDTETSYEAFIAQYPDSKFVKVAEDSIFAKYTSFPSIPEYERYIQKYPKSKKIYEAWNKIYILYTDSGDPEVYTQFLTKYPNYPYLNEVKNDVELAEFGLKMLLNNFNGFADDQVDAYLKLAAPTDQAIKVLMLKVQPLLAANQIQKAIEVLELHRPEFQNKGYKIDKAIASIKQKAKNTGATNVTMRADK